MSIAEIQERINDRGHANRADIVEAINTYDDPDNVTSNIATMLAGTQLTQEQQQEIMQDIESYL